MTGECSRGMCGVLWVARHSDWVGIDREPRKPTSRKSWRTQGIRLGSGAEVVRGERHWHARHPLRRPRLPRGVRRQGSGGVGAGVQRMILIGPWVLHPASLGSKRPLLLRRSEHE